MADITATSTFSPDELYSPLMVAEMLTNRLTMKVFPLLKGNRASIGEWSKYRGDNHQPAETLDVFLKAEKAKKNPMPGVILDEATRIIMVEADGPNAEDALKAFNATPTLTVRSRRGLHRFYYLRSGLEYPKGQGFYLVEKGDDAEIEVKFNCLTPMPPQVHHSDPSITLRFEPGAPMDIAMLPDSIWKAIEEHQRRKAEHMAHKPDIAAAWGSVLRAAIDSGELDAHLTFRGSWRENGTRAVKCLFAEQHKAGDADASAYIVTRDAGGMRCHNEEHNLEVLPMLEKCGYAENRSKVKAKLSKAGIKLPSELSYEKRHQLNAQEGDLDKATALALKALKETNEPVSLLMKDRLPVRIVRNKEGRAVSEMLSLGKLKNEMKTRIAWYQYDDLRRKVPAKPPMDVAQDILDERSEVLLETFPQLEGIVSMPTFRADGSIIKEQGYDAATGLYFDPAPGLEIPTIPEQPTQADIDAAKSLFFDELFHDFPFHDDASKAHALCLALLPFVRHIIKVEKSLAATPMHMIDASAPGSGKSLLLMALLYISLGRIPASLTYTRDEDEMRKMLTAALLEGASVLFFDNVNEPMRSAVIDKALTQMVITDRILGRSEMTTLPVNSVFALTSNNAELSRDLIRRVLPIRLTPDVERPEERTGFKHDPILAWVAENRGRLIAAAMTLIKAWFVAGQPKGEKVLGSFEQWASIMGGILGVIGVPGFLENRALLENSNDENELAGDFFGEWHREHHDKSLKAADLAGLAKELGFIVDIHNNKTPIQLAKSLSGKLKRYRDRVINGLQLKGNTDRNGVTFWQLTQVGAVATSPAPRGKATADDGPGF
jgi:hypothetical protein